MIETGEQGAQMTGEVTAERALAEVLKVLDESHGQGLGAVFDVTDVREMVQEAARRLGATTEIRR